MQMCIYEIFICFIYNHLSRESRINVTPVAISIYGDLILISKYYPPLPVLLGETADSRAGIEKYKMNLECLVTEKKQVPKE